MRLFLGCNAIAEFDAVPDAPRCSPVKLQHIMPWSSESGFWEATGQFQADGWQPSLASPRSSLWSDLRGGRVQGRAHMPFCLTNSTRDTSSETPMAPAIRYSPSIPVKSPPCVPPAPRGRSSPGNSASASARPAGRSRAVPKPVGTSPRKCLIPRCPNRSVLPFQKQVFVEGVVVPQC
jgi:hypothetical protein